MPYAHYLRKNRHGTRYIVAVHIPEKVRHHFGGKAEIRKSTRTADRQLAKRLAREFWIKCHSVFTEIESMGDKKSKSFRIDYATTLLGHTVDFGGATDPEMAAKEEALVREMNQPFLDDPELLKTALAAQSANSRPTEHQAQVIPFSEICDRHISDLEARIPRKDEKYSSATFRDDKPRVEFWRAYFGDRTGNTITKAEITDILTWLERLPARFTKKGLSPLEAIHIAKLGGGDYEPHTAASFNHYARRLKGILELCYRLDCTPNDLSAMMKFRNAKRAQDTKKLPFTTNDLQKIFPGTDYGQHFGGKGPTLSWESKFWIPLFGAFTGARVEELAQLTTDDVILDEDSGILYLNITESGTYEDNKDQSVKNDHSIRPVPIHKVLLDIGFKDYLQERRTLKQSPDSIVSLFASKRGNDGKIGSALSKWFTNKDKNKKGFIERAGITSKGEGHEYGKWSKSFHSFRHTAIDNLRHDKLMPGGDRINELDIALAVGHTDESNRESKNNRIQTPRYGLNKQLRLELRRDIIEQIAYPDVDFDGIQWDAFKSRHHKMFR